MAGTYSKHIVEVETFFKRRGGKDLEKTTKQIEKLGRGVLKTTTETTKFDSKGRGMVTTTDKMTRGFERFQMEQLGVMFAGMALNRAMAGLNATSREWLGIGELTSTMMGITMLEANMDLLEYGVIPLFDALTNLPPAAQKAIGYTAMALEGLGMSMMVGGQLMLGLDSTATLLSKIAGVSPELIFTEKGLSGLKEKLGVIAPQITKMAKYGAAGITIAMALQDLTQGDITAAIGDVFMAAGFLKGGKVGGALFIAGIGLKLVGEDAFASSIAKMGIIMLDTFAKVIEWINDSFKAIFTPDKIDWGAFNNVFDEFDKAATERISTGDSSRYLKKRMESPTESAMSTMESITTGGIFAGLPLPLAMALNKLVPNRAVGGKVRSTGQYFLHEGEEVIPKTGVNSGQVTVHTVYNVTVSDKKEFESLLRKNNQSLTSEVRRIVRV